MWQALAWFNRKDDKKTPTLFDPVEAPAAFHKDVKPYPKNLILKHELETLGLHLSIHPLDLHSKALKRIRYVQAKDLHRYVGKTVTTIGWQITGKTVRTKTGDTMKFVSFEDRTGLYETVFFPKTYNRFCHLLNLSKPYQIKGKYRLSCTSNSLFRKWTISRIRYKTRGTLLPSRHPTKADHPLMAEQ